MSSLPQLDGQREFEPGDGPLLDPTGEAEVLAVAVAPEQYQQRGRGRRPQCCSAAIAGDGRLDALADPRLASKRLADPRRDH